jgi:multiple antibiotic resistance protein
VEINWNLSLNFLAAILAIVNPIGLIPIWKELTDDAIPKVRQKIALLATSVSVSILLIFLNAGTYLLNFFKVDLAVFKVAGGILLLLTAISMINGNATRLEQRDEKADTDLGLAKQRFKKIMVPLAVPMLCGPGSITTVFLYGARAENGLDYLILSIILIVNFAALCFILSFSYKIETKVNDLFFVAFTRIFSIMVAAIAVQFMVEGLGEIFPAWLKGPSPIKDNMED